MIRKAIVAIVLFAPLMFALYFAYVMLVPTPKTQQEILAEQLSDQCKRDWYVLQTLSLEKYGHGGNPWDYPDYCNDFQRNLKIYKVTNKASNPSQTLN